MALAIKRYKDGSYTPLFKPWVRRKDYGTPQKKKTRTQRYEEQMAAGTYKKNVIDQAVDRVVDWAEWRRANK